MRCGCNAITDWTTRNRRSPCSANSALLLPHFWLPPQRRYRSSAPSRGLRIETVRFCWPPSARLRSSPGSPLRSRARRYCVAAWAGPTGLFQFASVSTTSQCRRPLLPGNPSPNERSSACDAAASLERTRGAPRPVKLNSTEIRRVIERSGCHPACSDARGPWRDCAQIGVCKITTR